jgi:hypothetical protein
MGKTQFKPLTERHGMCQLALLLQTAEYRWIDATGLRDHT